jgi:serine/threonine protein phosphatase PrpC
MIHCLLSFCATAEDFKSKDRARRISSVRGRVNLPGASVCVTVVNISCAARTRPGLEQPQHDFYCADASLGLFAVATGIGDQGGGWVASRTAIRALRQSIVETSRQRSTAAERLLAGLKMADASIEGSDRDAGERAQTAIAAAFCDGTTVAVARLGGCQSLLGRDRVRTEVGGSAQAPLDGQARTDFDVVQMNSRSGDRWLLCSGGFRDVTNEALADVLFQDHHDAVRYAGEVIELGDRAASRGALTAIVVTYPEFRSAVRLTGRVDCSASV